MDQPTPKTDALDSTLLVTMTRGELRELVREAVQGARTTQQEADRLLDIGEAAKVLSMSNPMTGRDSVLTFLDGAKRAFFSLDKIPQYEILNALSDDDLTVIHLRLRAETSKQVSYENEYVFLFRIAAGAITEFWEFTDTTHAFSTFSVST